MPRNPTSTAPASTAAQKVFVRLSAASKLGAGVRAAWISAQISSATPTSERPRNRYICSRPIALTRAAYATAVWDRRGRSGAALGAAAQPRAVDRVGASGPDAVGRDDRLLRGRDAVDHELQGRVERTLDDRQPDGSEVVVPRDRGEPADLPLPGHDRRTDLGDQVVGAVDVQRDEPPRRLAEVEQLRDRLLAAVAALGEVDGGAEPVELVRQRALVDLTGQPRPPGGDPQRLPRPDAGEPGARGGGGVDDRLEPVPRDEPPGGRALLAGVAGGEAVRGRAVRDPRPGVEPAQRLLPVGQPQPGPVAVRAEHRELVDLADLDAQHEPHRVEERDQR